MTDNEKRAHDLALFYMQVELSEGKIETQTHEDYVDLISDYNHHYQKILANLESDCEN